MPTAWVLLSPNDAGRGAAGEQGALLLDCIIPAHSKDFETLGCTVASIRLCCPEVRRVIVISSRPWDGADETSATCRIEGAEWLDEAEELWPFRLADLDGCGCPPGWLLQQLLKLHAPLLVSDLSSSVLVCDADVVWLQAGMRFLKAGTAGAGTHVSQLCTFDSESCPPIRSAVDLHRYDAFVPAVLPDLEKPRPGVETAVCHHAPFERHVLEALFLRVEEANPGFPFWVVFRDAARACGGRASEYELYHAFARRYFPEIVVPRPLAFAIVADFELAMRAPPVSGLAFLVAHSHLRGLAPKELQDREGVINGDVKAEIVRRLAHGHPPELAAILAGSGML